MTPIFQRNLTALKEKYASMWTWIQSATPDPRVKLLRSDDGYPNLRFQLGQGQTFHYYDMKAPLAGVRSLYQASKYGPGQYTIIFGLGLGYNLAAVEEKAHRDHKFLVVEENPTVLYHALHTVDFSEMIDQGRLAFVRPVQEAVDSLLFTLAVPIYRRKVATLFDPSALMVSSEDFQKLINHAKKELQHYTVRMTTQFVKAREMTTNELRNLPHVCLASALEGLQGAFAGRPAVVVSAGPSLKKNVHQLRGYEDKAVIIATAPVVRVLLAYDLVPHLVCSLDYSVSNMETLEDVWDQTELPLVFLNRIHPPFLARYQGPMIGAHQDAATAGNCPAWIWEGQPQLNGGGNVGMMAMSLAYLLGADPVILIGQDLAYSDGYTHSEGVVGRRSQEKAISAASEVMLDGLDGRPVVSTPTFASYLSVCQDVIKNQEVTTINATAKGARLEHAVEMTLQDALAEHATERLDVRGRIDEALRPLVTDRDRVLDDLRRFLAGARNARARAERGLKSNRRIRELLRTPGAEFSRDMEDLLRENEETSKSLQAFTDSQPLMLCFVSKELNFIGQADYVQRDRRERRAKTIRTGLKRNRLIIEATLRAARNFQRRLPPLIKFYEDLAEADRLLAADPNSYPGHLTRGRALAGTGRHAEAAKDFEAALKSKSRSRRALLALAQSHLALEQYAPAREVLARLLALAPGHVAAGRLLSRIEGDLNDLARRAREARDQEDWVSVQTFARKVLAARPDDRDTRDLMAWAESIRGERMAQDQEAMEQLSESRGRRRRFEDDLEEGKDHFQAGRYAEAIEPLARAAAHEDLDEDRQASIMLGCARGETGDVAGAEAILLRVMDEHPDWLFPMLNLGRVYLRHGRTEDGLAYLARAAAGSPSYAHHFLEIGDVRFQQGRYQEALEAFQNCSRALPGSYEARYKIGLCQLALGRPQFARQTLSDVLRMKPDFGPAMLALGRIDQKMTEAAGRAGEAP